MNPTATSRLAVALAAHRSTWETREGTAVLADLSGFTRLTESLVSQGGEGVELLHRSLSACFDALLGRSLELGGDVLGFAGDAALVWFDAIEHPDHVERAAVAAAAMPGDLATLPAALTARTRLRASVGLHTGQFLAVSLRIGDRDGVALCGPAMSTLARLEQAASSDEVLMSTDTAGQLPRTWAGAATPEGVLLDPRRLPRFAVAGSLGEHRIDDDATGRGEHRIASVGFVMVPGLDTVFATDGADGVAGRVRHVADLIARVAGANAVTLIDTDVGVDCVKFILAAGAPRAVDEDDARLLRTLRRIIDEAGVPLRAGAQRGALFSGLLGARERRTATVLGDTVNVAARALGRADDGDLAAADGLVEGPDRWMTADAIGPQQLKNRVAPVPMWRVRAVAPPPRRRPRASDAVVDLVRREEWDRLTSLWKETVDGGGASAAIVGEPGMGATELLADLVDLVGGAATSIVADGFLREVPYSGVSAIVTSLANAHGHAVADDLDAALGWLGGFRHHLSPTLQEWTPAALRLVAGAVDPGSDPGTAARRARQVLVGLITAAAARRWLLFIEDAGHLDHASQQVIAGLVAQATSAGHLVITTHDDHDSLSSTADETITLEALADDVVTDAIHELAPLRRDDEVARLVTAAGGNPLVLSHLLDHPGDAEMPGSVTQLAAVVIDALPDRTRSAVLDAAAFGAEFDAAVVATVLGDPDLASPRIWRQAHRVLRTSDERVWRFRHELFRDVASRTTSFGRRRRLHGAIADHLATDPDADPGVLALHLAAAGRAEDAYPRMVAAAASAADRGAAVTAVDLYERAIALARRVDVESLGRLHVSLGRARLRVGDLHGAEAAFGTAARRQLDPLERAWLHHDRANLTLSRRQLTAAERWIRRGTVAWHELEGRTGVPVVRPETIAELGAHLLLDRAEWLDLSRRHSDALGPARRALEIATEIGSTRLRALAHLQLEAILFALNDLEAIDHGRSLVALAAELDDDRLLDQALNNTGLAAMFLGKWSEALELYTRARAHAERCGHLADTAVIDQNIAFLSYRRRRLDEASLLARRARRVLESVHADFEVGLCTMLLCLVAAAEARTDDAQALLDEARARFERIPEVAMAVECDIIELDLLLRQGRTDQVIRRAVDVEPMLRHVEAEATLSFARIVGTAEAADPATHDAGVARIRSALARARELHLLYEVYLCLGALADVAGDAGSRIEHDELGRTLGIVGHD